MFFYVLFYLLLGVLTLSIWRRNELQKGFVEKVLLQEF